MLLYKNWDTIKEKAGELKEWLQEKWEEIRQKISDTWEAIKETIATTIETIRTTLSDTWQNIKETLSSIIDAIRTKLSETWESIKEKISTTIEAIKTKLSETWESIKSKTSEVVENIKSKISSGFNAAKQTVSDVFTSIKRTITEKIEAAKDAVHSAIEKIKGFFHFEVKLPNIALPHFSIEPEDWELGDLLKGSIPSLGIEWYAKAYDRAAYYASPTVRGDGRGFGDRQGGEFAVGESHLREVIRSESGSGELVGRMDTLIGLLYEYMPRILEAADQDIVLDDGTLVARIEPGMQEAFGKTRKASR